MANKTTLFLMHFSPSHQYYTLIFCECAFKMASAVILDVHKSPIICISHHYRSIAHFFYLNCKAIGQRQRAEYLLGTQHIFCLSKWEQSVETWARGPSVAESGPSAFSGHRPSGSGRLKDYPFWEKTPNWLIKNTTSSLQTGYWLIKNTTSSLQTGYWLIKNTTSSLQTGYWLIKNTTSSLQTGYWLIKNTTSSLQTGYWLIKNTTSSLQTGYWLIKNTTLSLQTGYWLIKNTTSSLQTGYWLIKNTTLSLQIGYWLIKNTTSTLQIDWLSKI